MQPLFDFFSKYIDVTLGLLILVSSQWGMKYFTGILPTWRMAHKVFLWSVIICLAYYFLLVKTGVFEKADISKYFITYFFTTTFYELAFKPLQAFASKIFGNSQNITPVLIIAICAATLTGCNSVKKAITKTEQTSDSTAVHGFTHSIYIERDSSVLKHIKDYASQYSDSSNTEHVKVFFTNTDTSLTAAQVSLIFDTNRLVVSAPGRVIRGIDYFKTSNHQTENMEQHQLDELVRQIHNFKDSVNRADSIRALQHSSAVTETKDTKRVPWWGIIVLGLILIAAFYFIYKFF